MNGSEVAFSEGEPVSALLARCGFSGGRFAVEIDGRVVPRASLDSVAVRGDERIEVVGLVGGG